jgi:hypothetical protein
MTHTLGREPLEEGSARHLYLFLKTYNTHKRQTSMPRAGFETTIPASKRPQTHALDCGATGIGQSIFLHKLIFPKPVKKFSAFVEYGFN